MNLRTLALVAAAAASPSLVNALRSQPDPHVVDRSISVSGDAVLNVVPDQATIHLAVDVAHAKSAEAASTEAQQKTARVLAAAQALGIDASSLKTEQLSVNAETIEQRDHSTKTIGYTATRTIVACLDDPKKVDAFVDAAIKAGANRIDSISFETRDVEQRRAEARVLAVKAARAKAELLVREAGGKLGAPRAINEGNYGYSGPWVYKNVNENVDVAGSSSFVAGAFAPGKITVNSTVTVVFDIQT
jgi:uncharacterized protein YggE